MYYDVVVSIYDSDQCLIRLDAYLKCGGFQTKKQALDYINTRLDKYNYYQTDYKYPCIEIEAHEDDGSIKSIITVD